MAGASRNCALPTFWTTGTGWRVVGLNCSLEATAGGKCTLSVTTCHTDVGNVNHGPVVKTCPKDTDGDGREDKNTGGDDYFDDDAGRWAQDFDGDGWSRDDDPYGIEPSWCDSDPDRNPGQPPTCDSGQGQDVNCNSVDDLSECDSPILVDVSGNGFRLSAAADGVQFDLNNTGNAKQLSWTLAGSDDAWLALDRNGNGTIDNGGELFGNFTPLPTTAHPNGFVALGVFDTNADGWIDGNDAVFSSLRLWHDSNHDGLSQSSELRSLTQNGVVRLSLDVKQSGRRDRHGNAYRYRARIVTSSPRDCAP